MKALAFALLCALSAPSLAAVIVKDVQYKAGNDTMKGYLAYDDAQPGKRPGVLVVPEWWGANDYAQKRARMLAEHGYVALVVDMYGEGRVVDNPKDAGALAGAVNKNPELAHTRFRAAETFLQDQPGVAKGQLAAFGYCFGGGVVLQMARLGEPLQAVASFHGVLATDVPVKPGDIKGRIAVFTGEADPIVPPAQVDGFELEMENAKVNYMLISYPGAKHTFTNRQADSYAAQYGLPLKYDPAADADSWAKALDLLKAVFH